MPRSTSAPRPDAPPSADRCAEIAHHLRTSVGDLVRSARSADRMAPVAAAVLDLLRRHGPLTTADLAARRQVRHQTMASTVADLIAAGYVVTAAHPVDRRKKLNRLTEAGRAALAREARQREAQLAGAMAQALSADDLAALTRGLAVMDRIIAALDQGDGGGPGQFITGEW